MRTTPRGQASGRAPARASAAGAPSAAAPRQTDGLAALFGARGRTLLHVELDGDITATERAICLEYATHADMGDGTDYMLRSRMTRMVYRDAEIPARPYEDASFRRGDIVIVNDNLKHYRAELQIVLRRHAQRRPAQPRGPRRAGGDDPSRRYPAPDGVPPGGGVGDQDGCAACREGVRDEGEPVVRQRIGRRAARQVAEWGDDALVEANGRRLARGCGRARPPARSHAAIHCVPDGYISADAAAITSGTGDERGKRRRAHDAAGVAVVAPLLLGEDRDIGPGGGCGGDEEGELDIHRAGNQGEQTRAEGGDDDEPLERNEVEAAPLRERADIALSEIAAQDDHGERRVERSNAFQQRAGECDARHPRCKRARAPRRGR